MIVFRNETHNVTLLDVSNIFACSTWMCCELGEGEEEVENQGWSRVIVSSQGTDLTGQWSLRMRANEADRKKAVRQEIVKQLSTGCTLDSNSTPHFSSFVSKIVSSFVARRRHSSAMLFSSAPRILAILKTNIFLKRLNLSVAAYD